MDNVVEDAVFYIPIRSVHPDPDQPRVGADDDLSASILAQGVLQAVTVRPHPGLADAFLLIDGERRWRGAGAAKLDTIPCRIRLDLEDDADRLITQITANTGKPLSPIEQARAFKKILDADEKLTQVELAKRLGVPRSTVGDRVRLFELPAAWLELIESGKLQVSHAPVLMPFREMKAEIHEKVIKLAQQSYEWRESAKRGTIEVAQFERLVRSAYHEFLHPLNTSGWPGCAFKPKDYKGLIVNCGPQYGAGKPQPYAADPDVWKPLVKAAVKEQATSTPSGSAAGAKPVASANGLKLTLPRTTQIIKTTYNHEKPNGVTILTETNGRLTATDLDLDVLLSDLSLDTVVRVASSYNPGIDRTGTRNKAAVAKAREAWEQRWSARREELAAAFSATVEASIAQHLVSGPGLRAVAFAAIGRDVWFDGGDEDLDEALRIAGVSGPPEQARRSFGQEDETVKLWLASLTDEQCARFVAARAALVSENLRSVEDQIRDEQEAVRLEYARRTVPWIERAKAKDGSTLEPCFICEKLVPESDLVPVDGARAERQCAKCKKDEEDDNAALADEDEDLFDEEANAESEERELVGA